MKLSNYIFELFILLILLKYHIMEKPRLLAELIYISYCMGNYKVNNLNLVVIWYQQPISILFRSPVEMKKLVVIQKISILEP